MTTPASKQRNLWWKAFIPFLGIIVLLAAALTIVKSKLPQKRTTETSTAEIRAGVTLAEFELTPFQGKSFNVSEIKSKILLINFWATWCEACMVEMPSILKLRERFKSQGFEVIAIDVDENPAAVLPRALKQLGIDFTVYTDPEQKLSDLFDVQAIPLTVIINRERKILLVENGERNWDDEEVHSLMNGWLNPR